MKPARWLAAAIVCMAGPVAAAAAQPVMTEEGAWRRWSFPDVDIEAGTATPRFFSLLASRLQSPLPPVTPFRYSVAVLVGIQDYENFPDFEFVRSDVEMLRNFLLGDGGFDVVYELRPEAASPQAVENLIKNVLRTKLEKRDRLLFFFSGHGMTARGEAGTATYLAFPGAKKDDFLTDLLAVSSLREWSALLRVRHALFVLDSCYAGSGVREKAEDDRPAQQTIMEALTGVGSRIVITAGTEDEKALEVTIQKGKGASLFTAELLDAIQHRFTAVGPFDLLLTIDQIFAEAKKSTTVKADGLGKKLSPHIERFSNPPYSGTFLFLNPRSGGKQVDPDVAAALGLPAAARQPVPAVARDVDVTIGLGTQRRSGKSLVLDFGVVGRGEVTSKLAVEVLGDPGSPPVPLRLAVDGEGLSATFTGGVSSAVGVPGKLVEFDVTLAAEQTRLSTPRIELRSGDTTLSEIEVIASPVDAERVVEAHSGPRDSGPGKSFSAPHRLCLGAAPKGYSLIAGSDEFWLTGDRRCGAWSTCEATRRDDIDVCWEFTLQGHDEALRVLSGVRQSEGHLRARYALRPSKPMLRASS